MTKKIPGKPDTCSQAADCSPAADAINSQPDKELPLPNVLMDNKDGCPGPVDFWLARLKKSLRDR